MRKQLHLMSKGKAGISRHVAQLAALLFALCAPILGASAQEYRGTVTGTVTDPTGGVVPSAKVAIENNATNATTTVGTTDRGVYTALGLDPGTYTVRISVVGLLSA